MTTDQTPARDATVDTLRGLAIGAMVWGHLGIAIYHPAGRGEPSTTLEALPPLWTEVLGGVAPPLFLFVCGMMIRYAIHRGRGSLRKQLLRMVVLLAIGATIDVAFWRIRPFTTVDVLYCIAVTLPLTHLSVTHLSRVLRWAAPVAVLAATPALQSLLGYSDYPIEMSLAGKVFRTVPNQTSILNHWIIDGWFPLFPWLGFALLGAVVQERRLERAASGTEPRLDTPVLGAGLVALVASVALGWPEASARIESRLRAGGAFMPPDTGYLLVSIGTVLVIMALLDRLPAAASRQPVRLLGRHPLFVYVVHFPLVKVVARLLPHRLTLVPTTLVIVVALAMLGVGGAVFTWLAARAWERLQSPSPRTKGVEGSRK